MAISDSDTTIAELVCPAGTPASLKTAVDAGADAVYCGFQNATNARNFPGLNFTPAEMEQGINYAHEHGVKVLLAANTFPPAGQTPIWHDAVKSAVNMRVDAIIVADIGVANHIRDKYPQQRLHLSVQAGASSPEAINYYCEEFNIKRVVLPRVLAIPEIIELKKEIFCEIECFIFGNHGLMSEGRCSLTNYITGLSTNMDGVCSPPGKVKYEEDMQHNLKTKLGDFTIDCFSCSENPGYPTICKGRYICNHREQPYYAFEEPVSLNLASLLQDMINAGVNSFKIEGRQRSRAYIQKVVSSWRRAIDDISSGKEPDLSNLLSLTEGNKQTEGAYRSKSWR
jgi:putative protease